jgi:hypothetical protein
MRAPPAVLLAQARMAQSARNAARTTKLREEIGRQLPTRRRELLRRGRQPKQKATPVDVRGAAPLVRQEPLRQQRELLRPADRCRTSTAPRSLVFRACVKNGFRHRVLRSQSPFLTPVSVEAPTRPRELLTGGWRSPDAHCIITVPTDTCQVQSVALGKLPTYHYSFSVCSVGWQNGRILRSLKVNALHGKALQLEKYSAKGV